MCPAMVFGGKKQTIETFVPGIGPNYNNCVGTLNTTGLPPIINYVIQYVAVTLRLHYCGISIITGALECYVLAKNSVAWEPYNLSSTFNRAYNSHPGIIDANGIKIPLSLFSPSTINPPFITSLSCLCLSFSCLSCFLS